MKTKFYIFTKSRMGLDNSVWLTMLIILMISAFILSFKLITNVNCSLDEISATGVRQQTNNIFIVGETVTFSLPNQSGDKFQWNFDDGDSLQTSGKIIKHKFLRQGAFDVVCFTADNRCEQSIQVNIIPTPPKTKDTLMYIGPSIIGDSSVNIGVTAHYAISVKANYYEWSASGSPSIQTKQDASFTFYKEGPQIITLKINGSKTYTKTILVLSKKLSNSGLGPVTTSFKIPPSVKSIAPASGGPGTVVTIMGDWFNNTTSVSFGGIEAKTFTIISPIEITATVNDGSQTGPVIITTTVGPSPSPNPQFTYTPPKVEQPTAPPTKDVKPPHMSISDKNLITLLAKVANGQADAKAIAPYFCLGEGTPVTVNNKTLITLSELCKRLQENKEIKITTTHIVPDPNNPNCESNLVVNYSEPKKIFGIKVGKKHQ